MTEKTTRSGLVDGLRKRPKKALRESERFARSIVDALSAHVAILDETGTIIAVNRAWREFAEANPPVTTNVCEGANYLEVCDTADGPGAEESAATAAGIRGRNCHGSAWLFRPAELTPITTQVGGAGCAAIGHPVGQDIIG